MRRKTAVALVHHPVLGRDGKILTTTITNLDLHDMARSTSTYGLDALYVVHPFSSQRLLAERIIGHWIDGSGGKRIPDRATALKCVHVVEDIDGALADLSNEEEKRPEIWTTAAVAPGSEPVSFAAAKESLAQDGPPVLLVFGTGWGLAPEVHERAAQYLAPIHAREDSGFNHLSVRAACAIALDRLFG
jgi:hypothetical protein